MAPDRIRRNQDSRILVIDSSMLLMIFENFIDLEQELTRIVGKYQIIVPSSILKELTYLSKHGKGRKKQLAKPALELVERYKVVDDHSKNADQSVIDLAKEYDGIVVSNDKNIRKMSKKEGLRTICLRGKNHLMIS